MSNIAAEPEAKPEAVALRMVFALGLAGLLAGLLIVVAYEATLPTIEANRAKALREAVFRVVPGSKAMQRLVLKGGTLAIAGDKESGATIYAAYDADEKFVGYAIPAQGAGFQDTIRLIYGFDPVSKRIVGMNVLESRETPGLGDKIYKDAAFNAGFSKLSVSPTIVVVKNGTKSEDNEVDGITGATISSKALVKILNTADGVWLDKLPPPGEEPTLQYPKEPAK